MAIKASSIIHFVTSTWFIIFITKIKCDLGLRRVPSID